MQKGHCAEGCAEGVRGGVCGESECKKVIVWRGAWRGCMERVRGGVHGGSECKKVIAQRGAWTGCVEGLSEKRSLHERVRGECARRGYMEGVCGGGAQRV